MRQLLRDNDPRVLELLKHEPARLKTFHDWPYNVPHVKCLAENGFFYFGDGDKVQCIYCLQVFAKWGPFDNPSEVHRQSQPTCPKVVGMPGATDYPIVKALDRLKYTRPCCRNPRVAYKGSHTTTMERLRFMYYLIALYAVISATGWRHVHGQDQINITTTTSRPSTGTQQLQTWKGVVGVKQEEGLMPKKYSVSHWIVDLAPCRQARAAIGRAISASREALPEMRKKNNEDHLEVAASLMQGADLESLIESLPRPERHTAAHCPKPLLSTFVANECEAFRREASQLEYAIPAFSIIDNAATDIAISVAALSSLARRFNDYWDRLDYNIRVLQTGRLSEDGKQFSQEPCPALLAQCESTKLNSTIPLWEYIQVRQVTGVAKENALELHVVLATPCLNDATHIGKYEILTLPYQDGQTPKEVQLPQPMQVWMKTDSRKKMAIMDNQVVCQHYSRNNPPLCVETYKTEEQRIRGSEEHLSLTGKEEETDEPTQLTPISQDQILVASAKSGKAVTLSCSQDKEIRQISPDAGLYQLSRDMECRPAKALRWAMKDLPEALPSFVTFQAGNFWGSEENERLMETVLGNVMTHMKRHLGSYSTAAGAMTLAIILAMGYCKVRGRLPRPQKRSISRERHSLRRITFGKKTKPIYVRPVPLTN